MKQRNYLSIIVVLFWTLFNNFSFPQWSYLGLGGKTIESLQAYHGFLYAGTDKGIFKKQIGSTDTIWKSIGLEDKHILALLVFDDSTMIASVSIAGYYYGDTLSIFKTTDAGTSWFPFQYFYSGNGPYAPIDFAMSYSQPNFIYAVRGTVAKSTDGGINWRNVWAAFWNAADFKFIEIDTVRPNIIWTGGTTMIFAPFLNKSTDYGESWQNVSLGLWGDQTCFSVALDPTNSNIVYVGVGGGVIKTVDGGDSWSAVLVPAEQQAFSGLTISRDSLLYAAGYREIDKLIFYKSSNRGISWDTVMSSTIGATMGVKKLIVVPDKGIDNLFFGTLGSGVFSYVNVITSVYVSTGSFVPMNFSLEQNYPNPFNSTTKIKYTIAPAIRLRRISQGETSVGTSLMKFLQLKVYDVLGNEVATLVYEYKPAGSYEVEFDGSKLSSGVYFYRLQTDNGFIATKKLVLLK